MNDEFWNKLASMGKMYSYGGYNIGSSQYLGFEINAGSDIVLLKNVLVRFSVAAQLMITRSSTQVGDSVSIVYNLNPVFPVRYDIAKTFARTASFGEGRMYYVDMPAGVNLFLDFSKAPIIAGNPYPFLIISTATPITGNWILSAVFAYLTVDEFKRYL